ncbi:CU044_2847 family protein [Streptomyces sp. NPDC002812]|uniref:CU044_2847 family protein n=1 Tax=Streptomyces sp. NPDC002812 TaxID=3154434 RepID=UPI003317B90F
MGHLVEFSTAEGDTVLIEVRDPAAGMVTRGLRDTAVTERAQKTFEEAVRCARPAVEGVVAQLRTIAESPDEIHVEFGLDLHAEAGAFIAAASTTANFTVAVTWHRNKPHPTTGQSPL